MHSPETSLEEPNCPLCSAPNSGKPVFRWRNQPYRVVRCGQCKLFFLSPRPTEAAMLDLYRRDNYYAGDRQGGYDDYAAQEEALRRTFRRLLKTLHQRGVHGRSLLEIGCGYGYLLAEAAPYFPERCGTDFSEAAVEKAIEMGIADPDRIGVIGHSHGGLMVANLLAHTDLFCAGIARSGSYNKTNQPFGFQGERRSLFEATKSYIECSPTFFADKVNEPILIIHGDDDSNPGTLTFQSEVFYEAVRGSGGTARLVLLPFEDHGYRAKESIEHVLWEQMNWFDKYVKNREVPTVEEKEVKKP